MDVRQKFDVSLIGARLKQARKESQYSVEDLAKMVGVHKATLHRYEAGDVSRINLMLIHGLSDILGVNPKWVLGYDAPKYGESSKQLTTKDKKDINEIISQTCKLLEQDGLTFDGVPADADSIQSIVDAMTLGLEMAKKRNKEKYNPNKNRKV